MSNKLKRSDKYDFFKGTVNNQKQKKTPKENFKFIFKIIKIVFYVSLLGLSLTGCIQSVAIRSSSTTGSGIEFYKSKDDVAPFVSTYKIINTTKMKDENGNVIFESDGVTPKYVQKLIKDTKVNYLVTNVDNTITNLKKQIDENSNPNPELYGQYDNYSSSLRIVNSKNKLILNTFDINFLNSNGKEQLIKGTGSQRETLFLNSTMLNEMNKSTSYSYDVVNKLITIPVFIQKRPKNEPTDINDKKMWENAIPSGKFQAFLDNSPTTPPVKINDKGQYIKNDNSVYTPEEVNKFVYSFEFDKVELTIDLSNMFASEKFARDYLQSLINVVMQFNQLDYLDKLPTPNPSLIPEPISITEQRLNNLNLLTSGKFIDNPPVEPQLQEKNNIYFNDIKETNQKYTTEMKNAILNYQANIIEILGLTGYSIPKLNFSGEEPDDWKSEFSLKFGTSNNNYNLLSNGSSISQKPIVNWNDAWGLGPFYGFVVYPIYLFVELLVGSLPSSLGGGVALLSIAISVIAARMLTLLLTYKSVFAQAKQQTLAPKKAKIDAKYAAYKGNKQMEQRKRQETSELYKKNNINMLTPLLSTLISMPIFLSMWRIIQGIPFIKSTSLWGINFSQTSWRELFAGEWQYLILIILAVVVQAGSQFLPRYLSKKRMKERSNIAEKEAMKKANRTQNIMMAIFVFMAVIFEAGVQIYWIVGGIWTMLQTLLIHHIQKTKIFREKLIKYV